jgi:uncharacterized DUF497 family protein
MPCCGIGLKWVEAEQQIVYTMNVIFDPAKDALNIEKHGISLSRANDFELFAVFDDDRYDYGERRRRAYGVIDGQTYYLAYVVRDNRIRAISLRRAHAKEFKRYVP